MFEETFPSAPAHRVSRSALGWRLAGGFGLAGEREKSAKIALNPQLRFGARNRRVASHIRRRCGNRNVSLGIRKRDSKENKRFVQTVF